MNERPAPPLRLWPAAEEGPPGADRAPVRLDSRRPQPLDALPNPLQVVTGHVDVFCVRFDGGRTASPRRHLFRVESGGYVLGFPAHHDGRGGGTRLLAVGGLDTEVVHRPDHELETGSVVLDWVRLLAAAITGQYPDWTIPEAPSDGTAELQPGERRRGPARDVTWIAVARGSARLMGGGPACTAGSSPVPLTSGMWIEAGDDGCIIVGSRANPGKVPLRVVADDFHARAAFCFDTALSRSAGQEVQRLARRSEHTATRTVELFDRLSSIITRRQTGLLQAADDGTPLFAACRLVADATRVTIAQPSTPGTAQDFGAVLEIARASRFRVRRTLLRGDWWARDAGPLLAWTGEERRPVALLPARRNGYLMVDPATGRRQRVDAALALGLAPEAVTFYPGLPSRSLRLRDLLAFSIVHSRGNYGRLLIAVLALGCLSWVMPLVTQVVVTSAIPRTELDQLAVCALALAVTALAASGFQALEATAMLRIEGLLDWKLQAAIIDRVLRLPASLFRDYTTGDFVDRSLGIDAIRRVLTGRTLRSLMAGVFAWFSVGLLFYYDAKLALVALGLIAVRGTLIVAVNLLRLYHETRYMNLRGKVDGLVLQLLAGIGKLRVAAATNRGLAVWSEQFAAQKRRFITAQRLSSALGVLDASLSLIATVVIFAAAATLQSTLVTDIGAFLAFFAAFGQAMAAIGLWTSGVSESLVVIPLLARLKPIISTPVEVSEDRRSPGTLSGAIELSRVTFRYGDSGPPVLDDVSLRVAPGEYVAVVGPSGSGKSTLFRLLLGFERVASGAVFYDGRAIDTLDLSDLRRQMGVVLQDGRLMTGSLYDNICGGVRLSLDEAWEAARLASLDGDIRAMPMGMHTMIAEGVSTISGGQRQRIMIARAIARRPRILLLDEATSSLDNQSQAVVSHALGNLNVTRIVIAHRLSTIREADRIVVMAGGKIVQSGTLEELSAAPGVFSDLAQRQLL
jgi:NHLM bacteriocin system ABC transporter ATP-binding protein